MSDLGNLLKHIGVVSNLNTEDSVLEYILTGHEPGATVYSDRDIAAAQVKERPGPFSRSLSEALGSSWPEIGTLTEAEIVQSLEDDSKELGIPLDELKDIKSREVHALMQGTFLANLQYPCVPLYLIRAHVSLLVTIFAAFSIPLPSQRQDGDARRPRGLDRCAI
jgi:hypothetical protein